MLPFAVNFTASAETTEDETSDYTTVNIEITQENTSEEIRKAIQEVLNTANEEATVDKMYKVVLPENSILKIDASLVIYSNTYFDLNGSTLLRDFSKSASMLRIGKSSDENTGYDGYGNITVTNGTFDGWDNEMEQCTSNLIRVGHSRNITFENLILTDNVSSHFIELGGSKDVTINNCQFSNQYLAANDTTAHEAIQIDALEEVSFPLYETYDGTACRDITITNCTFDNVTRGVGSHAVILDDNGYYYNIVVTDNTFTNISDYGVNTLCWINSKINNNVFKSCNKGILFRSIRSDLYRMYNGTLTAPITDCGSQIYNNTISTTNEGIKLYGKNVKTNYKWKLSDGTSGTVPAGDYNLSNIQVSNNIISTEGTAISVYHTTESTIYNNTITLSGNTDNAYGLYLASNSYSNKIKNNSITCQTGYTKQAGTYLMSSSSKNSIASNTITGNFQDAISLNSSSNSCTVNSNNITNTIAHGVYTNGTKNTVITNNTMDSEKGSGISIRENSSAKLIQGNNLSFSKGTSIVIDSSTATNILKNYLNKGNNGIYTNNANVTNIKYNQCKNNSFGIYIKKSSAKYVYGNTINNESTYGIRSTSSAITYLNKNNITNAKKYGIYATSSSGQINNNTIKNSGNYAMRFDKKSTNQIYFNTFSKNSLGNIYLDGAKAKVATNITTPTAPNVKNIAYNKNKLSWKKVASSTQYKVYRSTDNKNFKYIGTSSGNSFIDKKAQTGVKYYYKIRAINCASLAVINSSYSSTKQGYTKGVDSINKVTAVQKSGKKITVSWSSDIVPEKYVVYRKVGNSPFKKIATINGSTEKYVDKNVEKNKTYVYKLKPTSHNVNGKIVTTAFSKSVKVKVVVNNKKTASSKKTTSSKTKKST
jgi:parallel beta-helix repeat protein